MCEVQKDSTLMKLAAMEGAVPKQLQPTFHKVMKKLQQVGQAMQLLCCSCLQFNLLFRHLLLLSQSAC